MLLTFFIGNVFAVVRIKDIADIRDLQEMQLVGYSLVVGLDGSGDGRRSLFTQQSIRNMLQRFGLAVDSDRLATKNVAAVMVTANLSPFAKKGSRVDVTVSSMGDAKSLEGGTLLLTPLEGRNGMLYAYAQGNLSVGGINIETVGFEKYRQNYSLVGRIPNGAIVEQDMITTLGENNRLDLLLREPDFTTAMRVSTAIDSIFGNTISSALDAATIAVNIPPEFQNQGQLVQMIARLERVEVQPDVIAKVVINERTGTVVVGGNVRLTEAAVHQGSLTVKVNAMPIISQPGPFSQGQTMMATQTMTSVQEDTLSQMRVLDETASVTDLANALNQLKVTPREVVSIFQALKQAGALQAELIIM